MISNRFFFHSFFILMAAGCFFGCSTNPNTGSIIPSPDTHVMSAMSTIHPKPYSVTGQVLNQQGTPVRNCQVYLVKRTINPTINRIKDVTQTPVSETDSEGQYYLTFEPGENNDLWLTFMDGEGRYEPRSVWLNEKIGNSLLEYPGNNPIAINIVLEQR